MKNLILLSLVLATGINYTCAQGTNLDTSFGNKGIITTTIRYGAGETATSVIEQSDGKIVIAGAFGSATPGLRAVMLRYNKDGNLDQNFGNAGRVEMAYPGKGRSGWVMVGIQKNAGQEYLILLDCQYDPFGNGAGHSLLMARYKPDGTLDNSFGSAGWVEDLDAIPQEMIIDPNGKILLASNRNNGPYDFGVQRFLPNGLVDNAFGTNGRASRQDGITEKPLAILQQPDGKILVGGSTYQLIPNEEHMIISRYNNDGTVDSAFGTDGLAVINTVGDNRGVIASLALQSDGKIVACASADTGTGSRFFLTRLLQNGSVDNSFGYGGEIFTDFGNIGSYPQKVLVQHDDKIFVVGCADPTNGFYVNGFSICARYTKDGLLDNTFGVMGKDTNSIARYSAVLDGMITANRSLIVAGLSAPHNYQRPTDHTEDFMVMKYLSGLELGILDLNTVAQPVLYPNPVSDVMNISYEILKEELLTIRLVDMTGRTVQIFKTNEKKVAGKHQDTLQVNDAIPTGQYILQIVGMKGAYSIKLQIV